MLELHAESHVDHVAPAVIESVLVAHRMTENPEGKIIIDEVLLSYDKRLLCKLRGPAMGDPPIYEYMVKYGVREGRQHTSRLVDLPPIETQILTVVMGPHDGRPLVLYSCYPGPEAPLELTDPRLTADARAEAEAFWVQHALCSGAWKTGHYDNVVIEHKKGEYKAYCNPADPRDDAYPMKGITYPVNKGGLPGFTGQDGHDLDGFLGETAYGENGMFIVYRPDVRGEHETKFFFGLNPEEKSQLLETFAAIRVGEPAVFETPAELEVALSPHRARQS